LKLVSFRANGPDRVGFLKKGKIIDLEACYEAYVSTTGKRTLATHANFADMISFLRGGESAVELAKELESFMDESLEAGEGVPGLTGGRIVYDEVGVRKMVPLRPGNLTLMGGTYPTHEFFMKTGVAREIKRDQLIKDVEEGLVVRRPVCMFCHPSIVIGPDDEVFIPAPFEKASTHHELTLVIGRRGRNIPREKAYDYIYGYTILNDITILDIYTEEQQKKHRWTGFPEDKAYETTKPVGPYIVTKDEVPDPHDLDVELKVNGKTIIRGNTGDMTIFWDIPKIVEHCSKMFTLEVGDLISTGGVGPLPGETDVLKNADVIEAFIDGVGCLRNTIKYEVDFDLSTRTCRRAPELALPNDGNQYM